METLTLEGVTVIFKEGMSEKNLDKAISILYKKKIDLALENFDSNFRAKPLPKKLLRALI